MSTEEELVWKLNLEGVIIGFYTLDIFLILCYTKYLYKGWKKFFKILFLFSFWIDYIMAIA